MVVLRGRAKEMARALAVVNATARNRRSAVLLISGEAGLGRSAVLDAIGTQAGRSGFAVGAAGAVLDLPGVAGAALLLALRSGPRPLLDSAVFTELAGLTGQPLLFADRLSGALEELTERSPVLIALDDVEWADPVSAFALRVAAGRLAARPMAWVCTTRSAGTGLPVPWPVRPETLELTPLRERDVAAMAFDRLGGAAPEGVSAVLRRAAGNPMLITRLLDGMAERTSETAEPPADLVRHLQRALHRLAPDTRELVQMAAVLGRPFSVDEAGGLLPGRPAARVLDCLDAALAAGLLSDLGGTVTFPNELVGEAVAGGLTEPARRRLHRRCAAYLLATGHSAVVAAPHARSGAVAGDAEAVALLVRAAGETVRERPDLAADLLLEAFGLLRPADPQWAATGEQCLAALVRAERARDAIPVADALLARADDPGVAARLHSLAAQAQTRTGALTEALERLDMVAAGPGLDDQAEAHLQATRALVLVRRDTRGTVGCPAREAVQHARRQGDSAATAIALRAAGEAAGRLGRHTDALKHHRESRTLSGEAWQSGEIMALQQLDRYRDAEMMLQEAFESEHVPPSIRYASLLQDFRLHRLDAAESGARTLIELCADLGDRRYGDRAAAVFVGLALSRGDLATARERLDSAGPVRTHSLAVAEAWLESASGRPDNAVRILTPAVTAARSGHSESSWRPGLLRMATRAGLAAGDDSFTAAVVALAGEDAARNPGIATVEGVALQTRALLLGDVELARQATETLAASPRPLIRAAALADHGRLLLAAGAHADGVERLEQAWEGFRAIGAQPALESAQRALRRAGIRRSRWNPQSPRPQTGWESLSEAEARVARLVGAGRTNRVAAAELGLSANTVGSHLRSIFTKLDVQSRVQLAHVVHEMVVHGRP